MKHFHYQATIFFSLLFFLSGLTGGNAPLRPAIEPASAQAAEAGKGNWKQKWEETVTAAKKEGNLTVYSTAGGTDVRKTSAAFTEKYGIKVDVLSARGPELVQKMEAQHRAGRNEVDVVIAGGTNLVFQMKPRGYLDKLDEVLILPEVTDPKAWPAPFPISTRSIMPPISWLPSPARSSEIRIWSKRVKSVPTKTCSNQGGRAK